jgi:hypothetical protein
MSNKGHSWLSRYHSLHAAGKLSAEQSKRLVEYEERYGHAPNRDSAAAWVLDALTKADLAKLSAGSSHSSKSSQGGSSSHGEPSTGGGSHRGATSSGMGAGCKIYPPKDPAICRQVVHALRAVANTGGDAAHGLGEKARRVLRRMADKMDTQGGA